MNYGITYILRSMHCIMERHSIMGKVVQKNLMLNVRMREEFVFMERLQIDKFRFVEVIETERRKV